MPRGDTEIFPFCSEKETASFYPCAALTTVVMRFQAHRDESGTETPIPIPVCPCFIQIEGKQAGTGAIIVIAAAKSQPLRFLGNSPVGVTPTSRICPTPLSLSTGRVGLLLFPLRLGRKRPPFALFRPHGHGHEASDVWGESGTETPPPVAVRPHHVQGKGKQAVSRADGVSATAISQPLRLRATPGWL